MPTNIQLVDIFIVLKRSVFAEGKNDHA